MNFWHEVFLYMWHNAPMLAVLLALQLFFMVKWIKAEEKTVVMLRLYAKHNGGVIHNWFELKESDLDNLFAGRSIVIGGRHWWID